MRKLVFSDDFSINGKPDSTKWNQDIKDCGVTNEELQYYTDKEKNAYIKDGVLYLTAFKENHKDCKYTSAKVTTYGVRSFKYVRFVSSCESGSWCWSLAGSLDVT